MTYVLKTVNFTHRQEEKSGKYLVIIYEQNPSYIYLNVFSFSPREI